MDWQPIETARKDGTPCLIGWWMPDGQWTERRAWWSGHFDYIGGDGDGSQEWRGAWTDGAVEDFGYEEIKEYQPTHWMPLPAPPEPGA